MIALMRFSVQLALVGWLVLIAMRSHCQSVVLNAVINLAKLLQCRNG